MSKLRRAVLLLCATLCALGAGPRESRAAKVDFLWVIDNSPSMAGEQAVLSAAADDIGNQLATARCAIDWRMAVAYTDLHLQPGVWTRNSSSIRARLACTSCRCASRIPDSSLLISSSPTIWLTADVPMSASAFNRASREMIGGDARTQPTLRPPQITLLSEPTTMTDELRFAA